MSLVPLFSLTLGTISYQNRIAQCQITKQEFNYDNHVQILEFYHAIEVLVLV